MNTVMEIQRADVAAVESSWEAVMTSGKKGRVSDAEQVEAGGAIETPANSSTQR